ERWEGGSTLTQQLARTLFLSNKRTPARKAQEAVIALLLEQELSKKQILELYLNRIYLSGGVYGVETMAQNMFGKPASRLSLPEAAMIAGLIRAPSALSPWSNYDGAIERRAVVLQRMREEGFITAAQETAAAPVRPRLRPFPGATEARHGYAKEFLRQQGSAFKPFLFAAALAKGYSPVSVVEGLSSIAPQGPEEWTPHNAHAEAEDALTLRAALIESNNRAAALLQQRIGSRPVLRL